MYVTYHNFPIMGNICKKLFLTDHQILMFEHHFVINGSFGINAKEPYAVMNYLLCVVVVSVVTPLDHRFYHINFLSCIYTHTCTHTHTIW